MMIDRLLVENGAVVGVEAETGEVFEAKCVILATGTYLRGRIVYGQVNYESGPNGLRSANKLSSSLLEHGVELMRLKRVAGENRCPQPGLQQNGSSIWR